MKNLLQKGLLFLRNQSSIFIISIAIITLIFPQIFSWVKGYTQTFILGFIMLSMGLTLTINDFKILISRPIDILIGTLAQFTIMPLLAFSLTKIFQLDTALSIGLILVGCCPGGVSSNIMSFLCKGDVAFSVGMTTVSTLLAPFVTPFLVYVFASQNVDVDVEGMFINILIVTIIPITIGFLLNYKFSKNKTFANIQNIMPSFAVIALAMIVGGVISAVHSSLISHGILFFLLSFTIVFCHNTIGYIIGYFVGYLAKFNTAKKRTISIEIGMQNAGLATNLAAQFFIISNPMSIVPCAISCVWHSISGTILAGIYAKSDLKKKN